MFSIIITLILLFILFSSYSIKESFNNTKSKVALITQYYEPKWKERSNEINECLKNNLNNKHIDEIHLFVEGKFDFNKIFPDNKNLKKIHEIELKNRMSFKDAFEYSNNKIPKSYIKILSNSDIYFNDTLKNIHDNLLGKKHVLALTRHNINDKNLRLEMQRNSHYSQDSWCWKGEMNIDKNDKYYKKDGIKLGYWGCDNYIANLFKEAGYSVSNPCKSIVNIHLHKDFNKRSINATNKYHGEYHFVECV
jgi:hypothetical protein